MTEMDRIEKQIEIAAPAQRVWELIARPGWFINDGAVIEHRTERRGEVTVVHDPVHGRFPILTVKLDPPRYAAFRWLSEEGDEPGVVAAPSTLVEFWIEAAAGGGVLLRVIESGFSTLDLPEAARRKRLEENTVGWEQELAAARAYLDTGSVQRAVYLDAAPAEVWPILTDAEQFARWYAFGGAEIDLRPGGAMRLNWDEHGSYLAEVVAVEEPALFAYRIASEPGVLPAEGNSSLVTFKLKPSGRGTLLTVDQAGFGGLEPRFGSAEQLAAQETEGWEGGLSTLAELVNAR